MGVVENAQGSPREVRGDEDEQRLLPSHSNGKGALIEKGEGDEYLSVGADREDRSRGCFGDLVAGGILAQLISQVEDQLSEAEECIAWYERAKEKHQRQLSNLMELKRLSEEDHQDS